MSDLDAFKDTSVPIRSTPIRRPQFIGGFSVDMHTGNKGALAEILEEAAALADDMNLWYNGSPASSKYRETARYLDRIIQEEEA